MNNHVEKTSRITQTSFGQLSTGEYAQLYTLTNINNLSVAISNYGGVIVKLNVPDKQNCFDDIVLGYDNVMGYEKDPYYLGAIIGRYAGRIYQGELTLNNNIHQLSLNAPDSQLHSGKKALNKKLWQANSTTTENSATLTLSCISPDGEEGFPGEVKLTVKYTLTDNNELNIEYFAKTNKTTILNLTQHSYFNLAGHQHGDINNHHIAIHADNFLPMTEKAYPTGEIKVVANSPHDFLSLKKLGEDIDSNEQQIAIAKGYDNYWLLNESSISQAHFAAQVFEPSSQREMTIFSDQPSLILYTANYIDGSQVGKEGCRYQARSALCLETQRANSLEKGCALENVILEPNDDFYSKTSYIFAVKV